MRFPYQGAQGFCVINRLYGRLPMDADAINVLPSLQVTSLGVSLALLYFPLIDPAVRKKNRAGSQANEIRRISMLGPREWPLVAGLSYPAALPFRLVYKGFLAIKSGASDR